MQHSKNESVIFRVDSGFKIGTGHLYRCLNLAEHLFKKNKQPIFVCRSHFGNLNHLVVSKGFQLIALSSPSHFVQSEYYRDWLGKPPQEDFFEMLEQLKNLKIKFSTIFIDHYGIDAIWEKYCQDYFDKIIVIDDLANRTHCCNILVDCNAYENPKTRYLGLVDSNCKLLLGPQYSIIHEKFYYARLKREKNFKPNRILTVTFGGSDPTHETIKVINAILKYPLDLQKIYIIIGPANKNLREIEQLSSKMSNSTIVVNTPTIEEFFIQSDLLIMAGGTTMWERCCLGVPGIVISIADNQRQQALELHKKECHYYLGHTNTVSELDIVKSIQHLLSSPELLRKFSLNSKALVDGEGLKRMLDVFEID